MRRSGASRSLVVGFEVALARAAHRAEPVVRDILERGARGDSAVGIAVRRVVDEPAGRADPRLRGPGVGLHLGHRPVAYPAVEEIGRDDLDSSGEQYNAGPETTPRQAASVILLRGAGDGLELLLVKRNPAARFMGGAWVFPGGAVDAGDEGGDAPHRAAAVRELEEEAAVHDVDPLALVPDGAEPVPDGQETVDARWFTPQGALDAHGRGEILLVFPTIKHLEQLGRFDTADALLDY